MPVRSIQPMVHVQDELPPPEGPRLLSHLLLVCPSLGGFISDGNAGFGDDHRSSGPNNAAQGIHIDYLLGRFILLCPCGRHGSSRQPDGLDRPRRLQQLNLVHQGRGGVTTFGSKPSRRTSAITTPTGHVNDVFYNSAGQVSSLTQVSCAIPGFVHLALVPRVPLA